MPEKHDAIQAGAIYRARFENRDFSVEARRPAPLAGWWFCRGVETHDLIVIPETSLLHREMDVSADERSAVAGSV